MGRSENAWIWIRRTLAVIGFFVVLFVKPDVPLPFYALLGGLFGLPDVIFYQWQLNRDKADREKPSD